MSTPIPPILPFPDDDGPDDVPTREVDGDLEVDPDADDAQVNSADADRVAASGDEGSDTI